MAAYPPDTDTDAVDQDPRERGLERRSGGPAPWLVIAGIALFRGGRLRPAGPHLILENRPCPV